MNNIEIAGGKFVARPPDPFRLLDESDWKFFDGLDSGISVGVSQTSKTDPLPLPTYATPGSAGMDLMADLEGYIEPGGWCAIPTGLMLEIPEGFEMQIRPRSGLAFKHGITVLNSPGTIDSDFRGEVRVILMNHGRSRFNFKRGDRIAQAVFAPVTRATLTLTTQLTQTERGTGGFGSTGT